MPDGPLIVAANHPNSIVDPVLLSSVLSRQPRWLAKAPLFENPIARRLLLGFGAVPVRRAHEGGSEAQRDAVIATAAQVVADGDALGIFPEGTTHDAARLAPLKTGVGRIAVRAAQLRAGSGAAGEPVRVLPVVLHFPQKTRFRSEAVVAIGTPVEVAADADPLDVTAEVARRLEEHLVHVEDDEQERLLLAVRAIDGPRLEAELGVAGPAERHLLDREIAAAIRTFSAEHPSEVEGWKRRALLHLDRLEASGLSPGAIDPFASKAKRRRLLATLPLWPVALWGTLSSWLPYRLAGVFARRRARKVRPGDRTTIAWFGLIGGALIFPAAWLAEALVLGRFAGWPWAVAHFVTAPVVALAARRVGLEWTGLAVHVLDRLRVGRRPDLAEALKTEREELSAEVEKWRARLREPRRDLRA